MQRVRPVEQSNKLTPLPFFSQNYSPTFCIVVALWQGSKTACHKTCKMTSLNRLKVRWRRRGTVGRLPNLYTAAAV